MFQVCGVPAEFPQNIILSPLERENAFALNARHASIQRTLEKLVQVRDHAKREIAETVRAECGVPSPVVHLFHRLRDLVWLQRKSSPLM
jgi:hypothetical protein